MRAIDIISITYKIISRISLLIFFNSFGKNKLVKFYFVPLYLIKGYIFLYPCYKKIISKTIIKNKRKLLENKSIVLNNNNKNTYKIKKSHAYLYIIGNNLNNVNIELFKKAQELKKINNFEKIFYRTHPRNKFDLSNSEIIDFPIYQDYRDLNNIDENHIIISSYSSLAAYFLNNGFKLIFCKKSISIELKSQKKVNDFLRIYQETYPKDNIEIV